MTAVQHHPVRVFVLAPPLLAVAFERLVEAAHPALTFAGAASNAPGACAGLQTHGADVVLVMLERDEDLAELTLVHSRAKCIAITASHETAIADKAMLAGARGVVRTREAAQLLVKAIEKVDEGELWIDRIAAGRIFMEMARQKASERLDPEKAKIATLTLRERQAIIAVATNVAAPAKVIARKLCISEHTLRNHLTSIYSKLDLSNRLDLYAYATRHQLTDNG
jgi:DNA-binding NarL/FixJ family response regulator